MYLVQQITADPQQKLVVAVPGTTATIVMQMYYSPQQLGWFFRSLTFGTSFAINGMRISNSPNMLYQFMNQIPFGVACYTAGNREPTQQQDFLSAAAKLYILTADECQEYAAFLTT